jgi:diapolycopene oxygenase
MDKKIAIIGGGLGGLSAAISLRANGHDVTLYEKNNHFGGKLNIIEKDGYSFDLGPSILTMPHIFEALFEMHEKSMSDYVEFQPVRPHWRNFFEDGSIIDLTASIEDMIQNEQVSEEDILDLKEFYKYIERLYNFTNEVYFKNQSESVLDTIKYYNPFKIFKDSDYFNTMHQGVVKYIKNPYLIDILDYFIKYVGSSSYDAPAILNVLPYVQWKFDLWYVKGGLFELSNALVKLAKDVGVKLQNNSEVIGITSQNKIIQSIMVNDRIESFDLVVSNMEVIPFYERIVKEPKKNYVRLEKKFRPACSGFALHLGVDKEYPQLAHHNFFFSEDLKLNFDNIFHNHKLSQDPTIYLVAPMRTDKNLGPKGTEIIKILPHISVIDDDKPFTESEYNAFKEAILDKLERLGLENLRKHIVTEELWTPETIEEMYYSHHGAIYGTVSDRKMNLGFKNPKQSHLYKNLFFVGGTVNPGGGMPMVVLSGQQVVSQVERYFRKQR